MSMPITRAVGGDRHQQSRRAAPPGTLAARLMHILGDQAVVQQVLDRLGDGAAGQSGNQAEIGAGNAVLATDDIQQRAAGAVASG